ncbi:Uncharacterised protein [Legionella steigerwaltii]|uniref:Secreted protein n=1 Tax=Legionella steigerwaltii TaxID=460 RepID=A0A378LBX0_9GAMM|nr:hypothetical protein [Legionella steigerwaltii]KTD81073.1 hypothetical protein Lstg_0300 [Legionella steigerwaltii]STY23239.1 Uncharacterised protein [Legionella steigerwaltii]
MKVCARSLMFALCFLISFSIFAFEGHVGGGYHGAPPSNTGYHNNGYYNNYHGNDYYHNEDWYGGSVNVNHDDIWYDDNLNDNADVVVGVPGEGYYDPSCQTVDDCSSGTCVLVNSCE